MESLCTGAVRYTESLVGHTQVVPVVFVLVKNKYFLIVINSPKTIEN